MIPLEWSQGVGSRGERHRNFGLVGFAHYSAIPHALGTDWMTEEQLTYFSSETTFGFSSLARLPGATLAQLQPEGTASL